MASLSVGRWLQETVALLRYDQRSIGNHGGRDLRVELQVTTNFISVAGFTPSRCPDCLTTGKTTENSVLDDMPWETT